MGKQHMPRSLLSGKHALYKYRSNTKSAPSALSILLEAFGAKTMPSEADGNINTTSMIAEASAANTLIVPRKGSRLPFHVLPNSRPQPWELLPMRAAALKHYPNLFGEACLFFSSLQTAVQNSQPHQLVPCTKASLDLAKLLRNLGILSGFQVVQKVHKCRPNDYVWPPGTEPQAYEDLALYHHVYLRLAIRWDALKPVWISPASHALQQPLSTSDALPLSVRHLSRPSCPVLMTPADIQETTHKLQSGVCILYHHQLGLTCDAVTSEYGVPALGLAFLALPWVQTAQIKAALKSKAAAEVGLPLDQTQPLTRWRLSDWVESEMAARQTQLAGRAQEVARQEAHIKSRVTAMNNRDLAKAQQAMQQGSDLHRNVVAFGLLKKLTQSTGTLGQEEEEEEGSLVSETGSAGASVSSPAPDQGRVSLFGAQAGGVARSTVGPASPGSGQSGPGARGRAATGGNTAGQASKLFGQATSVAQGTQKQPTRAPEGKLNDRKQQSGSDSD